MLCVSEKNTFASIVTARGKRLGAEAWVDTDMALCFLQTPGELVCIITFQQAIFGS